MRYFHAKAIVLVALSLPLGACSSFLGINFARHTPRAAPGDVPSAQAVKAEGWTSSGRRQLADGQPGLAIETLQRALAGGEPVAPAVNGLGVAYARIGRFELAQRYFEQAAASDPTNPQYAENLARLMRSPAFAMRREGDLARDALQAAERHDSAAKVAQANAVPVPGQLQRISRGEVRIASAAPQAAPAVRGRGRVGPGFKPLIRITFAELASVAAPNRVVLPESTPAASAAAVGESASASARN